MMLREPVPERLLLDLLVELPAGRILCNTAGRAQLAAAYASHHPQSPITCWLLDLYQREQGQRAIGTGYNNLRLLSEADPPQGDVDVVAWAFSRQGNSELAREMLQVGHQRLAIGGRMIAAVDNPRDQWLQDRMQEKFDKVTRRACEAGVVYLATKIAPLRKLKDYAAEFAFRDGQRLIHLRTRPGVFSHRELDGGAHSLIKAITVVSGSRVLDLGCGSGAVALAAALRTTDVHVDAIDSNSRAIESTLWAASRNGVAKVSASLDCDGSSLSSLTYDLVLSNPPYYSDFRLAELFVNTAARMSPGGTLQLVTKTPQWYADHLPAKFPEVTTQPVGNYIVVTAGRA